MKISAIIVSYNVRNYLRQCLNALMQSEVDADLEIIVVDNHSFDNSVEMLKNEYETVKLIINHKNIGFAAAVNKALRTAVGDYAILLNPDAMIKSDTLSQLVNYLESNKDVGVIGCKVLDADGKLQLASRRNFPAPLVVLPKLLGLHKLFPGSKLFGQYNQTHIDPDKIQEVDAVSGACLMFPRQMLKIVGEFDERFFMYFEDTDFCYRVKQAGYKVIYNPSTQIIHYKGESLKHAPFDTVDVFHESLFKFYRKHSSEFKPWWLFAGLIRTAMKFTKVLAFVMQHRTAIVSVGLDMISIVIAFILSILFWYPYHYQTTPDSALFLHHWDLITVYAIFWLAIANGLKLYKRNHLSYGRALVIAWLTFLLTTALTYMSAVFAYSRAVLLFSSAVAGFGVAAWRIGVQILYRYGVINIKHKNSLFTRRAVILGVDAEAQRIGDLLYQSPTNDFDLVGFICDDLDDCSGDQSEILGFTINLPTLIRNNRINEIIIPQRNYSVDRMVSIIQKVSQQSLAFKFVSDGEHNLIGKGIVENLAGIPLVDIEFPLFDRVHLWSKRLFDILLASMGILLTSPFHLYFILSGKKEQRKIWQLNHKVLTVNEYGARIGWLRELPYQFTILKGEMSFVGSEIVDYSEKDPNILFKPGLTGLSQLKSVRVKKELVRSFDQYYIQNHSLIFDLEILLKTFLRI